MESIIDERSFPLQNYDWVSDNADERPQPIPPVRFYKYGLQPDNVEGNFAGPIVRTYSDEELSPESLQHLSNEHLHKVNFGRPFDDSTEDIDAPLVLRVIDFSDCSSAMDFVERIAQINSWGEAETSIMGIVPFLPDRNLPEPRITFDTGISFPRGPTASGGINKSPSQALVFIVSLPYFGTLDVTAGNQPPRESLSLFEYGFRKKDIPSANSTGKKKMVVHQIWFMVLANDMIAMFRSEEDKGLDRPQPLYPCQERVCMFQVLVHMVSNILALSQKRCLKFFNKEVSEKEYRVIERIGKDRSPLPDEDEQFMKDISALIIEIKNSKKVVESQVNILEDLQRLYGNIKSFIRPTKEEIEPAIEMIKEVVKERGSFCSKLDTLLKTIGNSKKDFLNRLSEENAALAQKGAELAQQQAKTDQQAAEIRRQGAIQQQTSIKEAIIEQTTQNEVQAKKTRGIMEHQRQVMSMLTIITTVFLPLGFFTSWFAMVDPDMKKRRFYAGGIIWGVCVIVTVLILLVTFFIVLKSRKKELWHKWVKKLGFRGKGGNDSEKGSVGNGGGNGGSLNSGRGSQMTV